MVLRRRIGLPTPSLPMKCSTNELPELDFGYAKNDHRSFLTLSSQLLSGFARCPELLHKADDISFDLPGNPSWVLVTLKMIDDHF